MNDAGSKDNKYQYNGKELNEDFGLNWSDYGARWYDAAVGRWNGIDNAANSYSNYSPYIYAMNDPLKFVDADGNDIYITMADGSIIRIKDNEKKDQFHVISNKEGRSVFVGSFDKNENNLIQLPSSFSFKNDCQETCGFTVKEGNENRAFIHPEAMAALLGVLAETATSDLTIVGFSLEDGSSPKPSTSHKNGKNGDLRYLKTDFSGEGGLLQDKDFDRKRQDRFNKSLVKHGWKSLLTEWYIPGSKNEEGKTIVDEGTHYNKSRHNNHLHTQGFKPKIREKKHFIDPIILKMR
jgi:RHS repeat-associated protein